MKISLQKKHIDFDKSLEQTIDLSSAILWSSNNKTPFDVKNIKINKINSSLDISNNPNITIKTKFSSKVTHPPEKTKNNELKPSLKLQKKEFSFSLPDLTSSLDKIGQLKKYFQLLNNFILLIFSFTYKIISLFFSKIYFFTAKHTLLVILPLVFLGLILGTSNTIEKSILSKNTIEKEIKNGLENLLLAKDDIFEIKSTYALDKIDSAISNFETAREELIKIGGIKNYYSHSNSYLSNGKTLIDFSVEISNFGRNVTKALFLIESIDFNKTEYSDTEQIPSKIIKQAFNYLKDAYSSWLKANKLIQNVSLNFLDDKIINEVKLAQSKTPFLLQIVKQILDYENTIFKLIGADIPKKYLVILQNTNEIRATGGFIGSLVLVDLNDGILNYQLKDVYDYDGQFFKYIEPPFYFKSITSSWKLRDANIYADFAKSAQQLAWFLEQEGGPSVDGVFALNEQIIGDLLDILWPVYIKSLNREITKDNYFYLLTFNIEGKTYGANNPKLILFELFEEVKNKILQYPEKRELISLFLDSINNKIFQGYFFDQQLNKTITLPLNIANQINLDETSDYLSVINTSLSGNKSDYFIAQKIFHHTEIESNGDIFDTITIYRKHTLDDNIRQYINKIVDFSIFNEDTANHIKFILGDGLNISYLRIYVPTGSQLVQVNASFEWFRPDFIKTFTENNQTVFGTILKVKPEEEKFITLKYKLPFNLSSLNPTNNYHFFYRSQSWQKKLDFIKSLEVEGNLRIIDNQEERQDLNIKKLDLKQNFEFKKIIRKK